MNTDEALAKVVDLSLANVGAGLAAARVLVNTRKMEATAGAIAQAIQTLSQALGEAQDGGPPPTARKRAAIGVLADGATALRDIAQANVQAMGGLLDEVERSIEIVGAWRASLAKEDVRYGVIFLAKADHLLWKKQLLDMACGRTSPSAQALSDHTQCRLGRWYAQQVDITPALAALDAPHKRVHQHGLDAAACFERGEMEAGMAHYALVEAASAEVMDRLQDAIDEAMRRPV
jgi:hypothetical protein